MKAILFIALITLGVSAFPQGMTLTDDGRKIVTDVDNTSKHPETGDSSDKLEYASAVSDYSKNGLLTYKTDVNSGEYFIAMKDAHMILLKKHHGIRFHAHKNLERKYFSLKINAFGAGQCINEVKFLFRDGKSLTIDNDGDIKCNYQFTKHFGGLFLKKLTLKILCTKEVKEIRAYTEDGPVEVAFTEHDSKVFMHSLRYFFEEIS